ncbi:probable tRNA (uracil-O(2)-)-methyltransferase [Ctenocephalides felis]|uniref:probable tRNA (uracil-O(2)-)-methyltransferase n=1 Tax=Ctenocephalides felis TaxID=7515 RepID=UPI000E6E1076|nr:probable tRNA (uracil-O(2)-)-methyltransferase [Ctenocephalides felis]
MEEEFVNDIFESLSDGDSSYFIICNENILKNNSKGCYDIFLIDSIQNSVYCISYTADGHNINLNHPMPFQIRYLNNSIILSTYSSESKNIKFLTWLENKFLKKVISWSEPRTHKKSPLNCPSLSLINKEQYAQLYHRLKLKYGKSMCEIWPDNTDPSKFVYEDIAIATYILLIWAQERLNKKCNTMQNFVDLGCGNGLLVHILNSEGYSGYGLDIRKRDIWDKYPSSTILKEKPFVPSIDTFPDVHWLIGNHSDEITPWLPITATRSSINTNYFVIPCCPYELNGKKYQRKLSSNSVYEDFLYYVQDISNLCGFNTKIDKLRIPSTKRTCLVGWNRDLSIENYNSLCKSVELYVQEECSSITNYTIREKIEKVQNCTQINKNIQEDIVNRIVNELLNKKNNDANGWNEGGCLNVKELAEIVPNDLLHKLKSECGGLQTLLKNQNIFNIRNGMVSLCKPKTVQEMKELYVIHKTNDNRVTLKRKALQNRSLKPKNLKLVDDTDFNALLQKKDCWYFYNHPQGCPLTNEDCSFKHK